MNRTRSTRFVLAVCGVLAAAPLRAQVCDGFPSLRDKHFRVAAGAASYTYAMAIAASFTAGKTVFGTVGVGRTRNSDLDASTFDLHFGAGADIALGDAHRVFLCPVAGYSVAYGPNDFLLTGEDYRSRDGALGLGLAAVAVKSRRFALLVAGGLRGSRLTTMRTGWPAVNNSYGLWSLTVGLVLDDVLTVRPSVTVPFGFVPSGTPTDYAVPFGREEGETSLGISVAVNLGKRPSLPSR